ncbi:hypothetical protein SASPL_114735 [Salvia splendens]|uniref:Uncharacterized protein n=1 Tax=Salvia splendens TaxID=180675 RepID=A0A8X8Y173_SALSN|nr:hypothetical protein SASPL_114735 [Salvia splendens]
MPFTFSPGRSFVVSAVSWYTFWPNFRSDFENLDKQRPLDSLVNKMFPDDADGEMEQITITIRKETRMDSEEQDHKYC